MTDLDKIKAGEYELVSEVFEQPAEKQVFGQAYQFTRYVKGDLVKLNEAEARRLYAAGAVVRKGERERLAAEAAVAQARAALALLPPEVREQLEAGDLSAPEPQESVAPTGDGSEGSAPTPEPVIPPTPDPAAVPHGNASTDVWKAHAESLGIQVPDGASRDDIKAMVAANQV